jgi:DNA-directed RNA polymerase subunit M
VKVWVCPNAKRVYDKELQSGQRCPVCGEEGIEFAFSEIDNLLKQKWEFKKSVERANREKKLSSTMKFCPKCGSANINFLVFYRPSIYKCLDCDYEGAIIIEDSKLSEKIRKQHRTAEKETG